MPLVGGNTKKAKDAQEKAEKAISAFEDSIVGRNERICVCRATRFAKLLVVDGA
jgi:hypothetical protein